MLDKNLQTYFIDGRLQAIHYAGQTLSRPLGSTLDHPKYFLATVCVTERDLSNSDQSL